MQTSQKQTGKQCLTGDHADRPSKYCEEKINLYQYFKRSQLGNFRRGWRIKR